jgi:DNA-binding winged helix-turn-helix (wHTH) protein/Flp pilus assembly protein TadD
VCFGEFKLNPRTGELRINGTISYLQDKPLQVLILLLEHPGQLVTRNELMKRLWSADTFVDFDQSLNKAVNRLREALEDSSEHPRFIETLPRRGYRFIAPVTIEHHREPVIVAPLARVRSHSGTGDFQAMPVPVEPPKPGRWKLWQLLAALLVCATIIAGGVYSYRHNRPAVLTEKDTIVLADFTNTTGDSVFDDTLKQALAIQLKQSPFLSIVSEQRVQQTLRLMDQPEEARLTPKIASELCQRVESTAVLEGAIASLGSEYVLGLKAVNCRTGGSLAQEQGTAASKEKVLSVLDEAAVKLRAKLGESLSTVEKFATPIEQATTPSLEALKAFSLGEKWRFAKGDSGCLPFYKRAVELDPNFALAHRAMSVVYVNLSEAGRAAESARKAYALREKVSERERFSVEATYYMRTTGELEKAAEVYQLWQQTYPRDFLPHGNLGVVFFYLGNWEKALEEERESLRLDPNRGTSYSNLSRAYTSLNRLDEAEAVHHQVEERKLESEYLLLYRYHLAYLKGDAERMARTVSAAMGQPGKEDFLLMSQADTEGWHGRLTNAHELTRLAMDSARRNDAKEAAALYQTAAALREVESGNREQARADAYGAVELAPNRDVWAMAALALARAGYGKAEKLAAELDKTFPLDTLVQRYWLPTIQAAVALQRKDPNRAVELLKVAHTIELSQPTNLPVSLCPVYLRGEAYLMLRDGNAAAAEFQKFVDHRGLVANFPWGVFARLGFARAYALQGDTVKARAAYQDFLTIWKDADPDIPILKQAKAEYAKLQ